MDKLAAQIEILTKFAEYAEDLLIQNGEEYTADDVIKVASFLIDNEIDTEQQEKVAEAYEAGRTFFLKEAAKGRKLLY